jgi:serine protease Do
MIKSTNMFKTSKNQNPIVKIAKEACPAVITIVVSKDLPKVEGYFLLPYGNQELVMPDSKTNTEKTKIGGGPGFIISPKGYISTCAHVV